MSGSAVDLKAEWPWRERLLKDDGAVADAVRPRAGADRRGHLPVAALRRGRRLGGEAEGDDVDHRAQRRVAVVGQVELALGVGPGGGRSEEQYL